MKKILLFLLLTIFNLSAYMGLAFNNYTNLQGQAFAEHVFNSWDEFYVWLDSQGKTTTEIASIEQTDDGEVLSMNDNTTIIIMD